MLRYADAAMPLAFSLLLPLPRYAFHYFERYTDYFAAAFAARYVIYDAP